MQMQPSQNKQLGKTEDKQTVILLTFEEALGWCVTAAAGHHECEQGGGCQGEGGVGRGGSLEH